jgi:hypothetical protein
MPIQIVVVDGVSIGFGNILDAMMKVPVDVTLLFFLEN